MLYLIYAILFLIGIFLVILMDISSSIVVKATVLESRERLLKKDGKLTEIKIEHALSYTLDDEEKILIVDCIPIRETNGSVVKLKLDKKTLEPAEKAFKTVLPATFAMFIAMLFCLYLFACDKQLLPQITFSGLIYDVSEYAFVFPALCGFVLCAVLLSDSLSLLNPAIIKVSGNYEGIIHSGNFHRMTKYYSLWYGEFRQHARCIGGTVFISDKSKEVTLFFNTKTGEVRRKAAVIRNACLGVALLVLVVLYIVFNNKI